MKHPAFRTAKIHVGWIGNDMKSVYKDDNGKLWRYENSMGFPSGEVRAITDQYGGIVSPWFDQALLPSHDHDELNAWIDRQALLHSDYDEEEDTSEEPKKKPVTKTPTAWTGTPKPKAPVPTVVATPAKAPFHDAFLAVAALAPPVAGYLFAGLVGGGIGLAIGGAALVIDKMSKKKK